MLPFLSRRTPALHQEVHVPGGGLVRDFVFGANDGLVAAFAVVSGVHGANLTSRVIFVAGMAELVGGMIAMGLGAYLSVKSALEYVQGERRREEYEVEHYPERERQEVFEIYREKGFEPPILDQIVDHICADKKRWVNIMMSEELNLAGEERLSPIRSALATGAAYAAGACAPVLPYASAHDVHGAFGWSMALTIASLFLVGASKTVVTGMRWWRSGLEATLIGALAAGATYGIGAWVGSF